MDLGKVTAKVLATVFIISLSVGFAAVSSVNLTGEEEFSTVASDVLQYYVEEEIEEGVVEDIEQGDKSCTELEDDFREFFFSCEEISEQGFRHAVQPEIDVVLEDHGEEINDLRDTSKTARNIGFLLAAVSILGVFYFTQPTINAFKTLSVILIIFGITMIVSQAFVEHGTVFAVENTVENMGVEPQIQDRLTQAVQGVVTSLMESEPVERELRFMRLSGLTMIISSALIYGLYRFGKKNKKEVN